MKIQFNSSYEVDNRYRGLDAPTDPPHRSAADNSGPTRFLNSYVNKHRDHLKSPKGDYLDKRSVVGDSFGKHASIAASNYLNEEDKSEFSLS